MMINAMQPPTIATIISHENLLSSELSPYPYKTNTNINKTDKQIQTVINRLGKGKQNKEL